MAGDDGGGDTPFIFGIVPFQRGVFMGVAAEDQGSHSGAIILAGTRAVGLENPQGGPGRKTHDALAVRREQAGDGMDS